MFFFFHTNGLIPSIWELLIFINIIIGSFSTGSFKKIVKIVSFFGISPA
jgi:hypothetical protein